MDVLENRLASVFSRYPGVAAVYLFGSRAEGRASQGSDIDLALVPARPDLYKRRLDILAALAGAGIDNVDMVIIDKGDIVLRYEAIRNNHLIYARPDFDHGSYYSRALREYLDFLPILSVQRSAYKDRLRHGQPYYRGWQSGGGK